MFTIFKIYIAKCQKWNTGFLFLGFKHRYTVTTTPTEEIGSSDASLNVNTPKSPGPQRLRLLSCKFFGSCRIEFYIHSEYFCRSISFK